MAVATLYETWVTYQLRKSQIELELTTLQAQKSLALSSASDIQQLKSREISDIRDYFKNLYSNDLELQEKYADYTEIPDFEEEIDKINAKFQQQLDELAAWEMLIDNQITTLSTELKEIEAFEESCKSKLSANITDDFDYGLGGGS